MLAGCSSIKQSTERPTGCQDISERKADPGKKGGRRKSQRGGKEGDSAFIQEGSLGLIKAAGRPLRLGFASPYGCSKGKSATGIWAEGLVQRLAAAGGR